MTIAALTELPIEHTEAVNKFLVQFDTSTVVLAVLAIGIIQFLIALWLKSRLENSIRHEYSKKLEEFKYRLETRKRAEHVAAYMAKVAEGNPGENFTELNKMAWELSLWLPAELYQKLARAVVENQSSAFWKGLLIDIRKEILGDEAGNLIADNIIHHTR